MENEQNRQHVAPPRLSWRGRGLRLAALCGFVAAGLAGGYFALRSSTAICQATPLESRLPSPLRDWTKPDLVLIVSGQMHGYIGPCGCSQPQYGGLYRRYNLVEILRQKGWPVVGVDLGELTAAPGQQHSLLPNLHQQSLAKLRLSMEALKLMGYRAIGVGKNELQMPLSDALSYYSIDHPRPRPIALNLADAWPPGTPADYYALNVRPWEIVADFRPRLGITSMIGTDLKDDFKGEKFLPTSKVLVKALQTFAAEGVELGVVMYQEYPHIPKQGVPNEARWIEKERHQRAGACAQFCDEQRRKDKGVPPIGLVLSLTDEPEPPGQLMDLAGTPAKLLEIGHKGRYVGVVGVYRKGSEFELKYQLVSIGPEFDEPVQAGAVNPVLDLLEKYTRDLERNNLLAKVARSPHHTQMDTALGNKGIAVKFVGSEKCAGCHKFASKVWSDSHHAHAFDTLVTKAKEPTHRQFDPECVVCHTVGLRHPTGYYDAPIKASKEEKTAHNARLENVGCESCHGPASAHVDNPDDASLYALINPFRPTAAERQAEAKADDPAQPDTVRAKAKVQKKAMFDRRMGHLDINFCQKCHDMDNDVNWTHVPFVEKWNLVDHTEAARARQAAARAAKARQAMDAFDPGKSVGTTAAPTPMPRLDPAPDEAKK